MVKQMHATLFDAIKDHEQHLETVVYSAFAKALSDLGSQVYNLEWASASARVSLTTELKVA